MRAVRGLTDRGRDGGRECRDHDYNFVPALHRSPLLTLGT
jgi:hypothetical protein